MTKKINESLGLLGLLIVIFVVKPNILNHAFNTLLGRIALIAMVIYFSKNNMFLGLFVALCLILGFHLQKILGMMEGFEPVARTIGDDSQPPKLKNGENVEKIKVLTTATANEQMKGPTKSTPSEVPHLPVAIDAEELMKNINERKESLIKNLKEIANKYNLCDNQKTEGVDRQTVEESIRPMRPSSVPVSKNDFKSGDNVAPSDKAVEGFAGMCASCM